MMKIQNKITRGKIVRLPAVLSVRSFILPMPFAHTMYREGVGHTLHMRVFNYMAFYDSMRILGDSVAEELKRVGWLR